MKWYKVLEKFAFVGLTGAVASVGQALTTGQGLEGVDPKVTTLVGIIAGTVGAVFNWYKNRDK